MAFILTNDFDGDPWEISDTDVAICSAPKGRYGSVLVFNEKARKLLERDSVTLSISPESLVKYLDEAAEKRKPLDIRRFIVVPGRALAA